MLNYWLRLPWSLILKKFTVNFLILSQFYGNSGSYDAHPVSFLFSFLCLINIIINENCLNTSRFALVTSAWASTGSTTWGSMLPWPARWQPFLWRELSTISKVDFVIKVSDWWQIKFWWINIIYPWGLLATILEYRILVAELAFLICTS